MPLRKAHDLIRHDIRRIRTKGSFSRNSFLVFSGNTVGLISQLVLTPLVARVYGPEAYGIYGLFIALVMNLSSIADLGYTHAYVLPRDTERFFDLKRLSLSLLSLVVVGAIVTTIFKERVFFLFPSLSSLGDAFLLIPVGILLYSLNSFHTQWLIRLKEFRNSTMIGVSTSIGIRVLNLIIGLITKGAQYGLIAGELITRTIAMVGYWIALPAGSLQRIRKAWSWKGIFQAAREYRRYPLLIFPERWISLLGQQLPLFFMADDLTFLGHYALAASLLLIPLRLFGFSFSPVYLQKVAENVNDDPDLIGRITKGLYKRLLFIGLVPFLAMIFFSDVVFGFVFGLEWRNAGVITSYLGAFFYMRLLTEPMISLFHIHGRQHILFIFRTVLTATQLISMFLILQSGYGAATIIMVYAGVGMVYHVALSVVLLNTANLNGARTVLFSLLLILVTGIVFGLLRQVIIGDPWPRMDP